WAADVAVRERLIDDELRAGDGAHLRRFEQDEAVLAAAGLDAAGAGKERDLAGRHGFIPAGADRDRLTREREQEVVRPGEGAGLALEGFDDEAARPADDHVVVV